MTQLNVQYRYLFLFFQINLLTSQTCENHFPDFFYNVDFAGPFFNQAVYNMRKLSVSTLYRSPILNFTVDLQTRYTRPSYYYPTRSTIRTVESTPDTLTVTSSDSNFVVEGSNHMYTLYTNTYPLNYFLPFNRYVFYLIAQQNFSDQRESVISRAIVQINLTNDNVHSPIFIPNNPVFYISEATPSNTEFGTVYATDADNDGVEYSISYGHFRIDRFTGVLRLEQDFLSSPLVESINMTITATDDGSSCLSHALCDRRSNSTTIQIIVTPINRYSPRFLENICGGSISLREKKDAGTAIANFTVWDDDRAENGMIDISFPSEELRTTVSGLRNTAYSQFYLDLINQMNATRTAILRANTTFDYDKPGATRVWFLNILATDRGTPSRQALCSVHINLLDENDEAPVFLMTSWNYTIYNSPSDPFNNRTLRIIAFDVDSGLNSQIDYYIGTRNVPYFSIERETGKIILEKNINDLTIADISRFPIRFEVYAQDRGTPRRLSSNNATVTIFYSNSNDFVSARWIYPSYDEFNINITEKFYELYPNQPLVQEGVFDGTIAYELTSQIPSILTISSPFSYYTSLPFRDTPVIRNGARFTSSIVVTSGLHAEIQDKYILCLRVLVDPPLMRSVIINLNDENDQIPTFDIRSFVASVLENEVGYRVLARIQAFDRDITPKNNLILYKANIDLSDNETIRNFHVELNGTIWTNTTFRREDNRTMYRLFITAYNEELAWNATGRPSQDFQFDIQVISVNRNEPRFDGGSSAKNIFISEKTASGTICLNLTIIDADINTDLNLGILSGNVRNAFAFTLLSNNSNDPTRTQYEAIGQLTVVAPLDYELIQNYTLVLFAFDTRNLAQINVTVYLEPQNTKAPVFDSSPDCPPYQYGISENSSQLVLNGPRIQANDPDLNSSQLFHYEIYDPRRQLDLANVLLTQIGNYATLGIQSPGLSRDLPFGSRDYRFGIRVTDENGTGVSTYTEASIQVTDINNQAPIPMISSCIPEGNNPPINITFKDYDDPVASNTVPYTVTVVSPSNFIINSSTLSSDEVRQFEYNGILNRSLTKNFTVILNASDSRGLFGIRTISIIVCDQSNTYRISDGSKRIKVIYVQGYQNSLRNVSLGSIYVQDLNDWYRADRQYSTISVSNNQIFDTNQGNLSTLNILLPGVSNLIVNVTKPAIGSSALSIIHLEVESIDSEYVRNAVTIRIRGEYPETILGDPLDKLRDSLASLLNIGTNSIIILTVRSVFRYQSPYDPPESLESQKARALTDVIFYVLNRDKFEVKRLLNDNLNQFQTRFQIQAVGIEPDPCQAYSCPIDLHCRATRTIHPRPHTIDANVTSFVGINILNSADCVNLSISSANCSSVSLLSDNNNQFPPLMLEQTFGQNGVAYAEYDGTQFSNLAPTRFSFDFMVSSLPTNALVLLYGRNSTPIDQFFWIAVEIDQFQLKFHFRDLQFLADQNELNTSTWYHVECQFIHSTILVSINDCQYRREVNDTVNTYDLSPVRLYLGGLPMNYSLVAQLYPALKSINNFTGSIRNVVSNGCYLNMLITDGTTEQRLSNMIIPWYTWLIMALVLLLLATILVLTLLTCIRRKQQLDVLKGIYTDGIRETIIDYKDTAGEEDHSTYNLRVLKKPVSPLSNGNIIPNDVRSEYIDPRLYRRPSLGQYIEEKLHEHVLPYANDTQLHYLYEGEGSIASNLSSIESPSSGYVHDPQFLHTLEPRLADLHAGHRNVDDQT